MKHSGIRKFFFCLGVILETLLISLAVLLIFSYRWMMTAWADMSIDELLFQLSQPLQGTGGGMIGKYIINAVVPAVIAAVIFGFVMVRFRKKRAVKIIFAVLPVAAVLSVACTARLAWVTLGADEYFGAEQTVSSSGTGSTDFIETYYVDPATAKVTFPEKKRNLIYIFLESVEMTYTDKEEGGAFEQGCIPELTELAKENYCFAGKGSKELEGGISMPGSTWTIGAMFSQTSGLPLQVAFGGNSMESQSSFFPGVTTIGDMLQKEGYNQTLLIGSDATFGGRRLYFTEHGNYNMEDYPYAKESGRIPQDYHVFWGYEDAKLFEYAKEDLLKLSKSDQPFNLTMLTVDTHFEDGYICEQCPDTYWTQYANVMACSSKQVDAFVKWCQEQDFYENTTIIINGDHPTMDADFCENVDSSYQRRTYTCVINPAVEPEQPDKHRTYTTFDNFPTTVAALGATIEGDRLGLGTNLLSSRDTLAEELGVKEMAAGLRKQSKYLQKLSDIDQTFRHGETQVNDSFTAAFIFKESEKHDGQIVAGLKNIKVPKGTILTGAAYEIYSESDESDATMITVKLDSDGSYDEDCLARYITESDFSTKNRIIYCKAYLVQNDTNLYFVGSAAIPNSKYEGGGKKYRDLLKMCQEELNEGEDVDVETTDPIGLPAKKNQEEVQADSGRMLP